MEIPDELREKHAFESIGESNSAWLIARPAKRRRAPSTGFSGH
jgi:hypothetical protein